MQMKFTAVALSAFVMTFSGVNAYRSNDEWKPTDVSGVKVRVVETGSEGPMITSDTKSIEFEYFVTDHGMEVQALRTEIAEAGSEIFRSVSKLMNQATPGEVREYKGSFRHFRDVRALLDHKITDGSRRYITIKILKVDGLPSNEAELVDEARNVEVESFAAEDNCRCGHDHHHEDEAHSYSTGVNDIVADVVNARLREVHF